MLGTWDFVGMECDGQSVATKGYTSTITVEDAAVIAVDSADGCKVTQEASGIDAVPSSVRCDPTPCTLTLRMSAAGQAVTTSTRCPDDFPVLVGGATRAVDGDAMKVKVKSGSVTCTIEYRRR